MSTVLTPPSVGDWSGETVTLQEDGSVLIEASTSDGTLAACVIDGVVPGHTLTLSVDMYGVWSPISNGNYRIIADDQVVFLPPFADFRRGTYGITVTATSGRVQLAVPVVNELRVFSVVVEDATVLPDRARPCDVVSVQALIPVVGVEAARFGRDRFGSARLTEGRVGGLVGVFGRSMFGVCRFWSATTTDWQDITRPVTALATVRGVSATGPVLASQVGTLTVDALDALDPRQTGLHHGTAVRLLHWPTRTVLFSGTVSAIKVTPQPPTSRHAYSVELTAADTTAHLASQTRHGAKADGGDGSEAWTLRIARLMASAPQVGVDVTGESSILMCPTVWETSLARHLDAACASVGGAWMVTRDGRVQVTPTIPTHQDPPSWAASSGSWQGEAGAWLAPGRPTPAWGLTLTDEAPTRLDAGQWSYTGLDASWASGDVVSEIQATNHPAALVEGAWQAADQEVTVTDASTTAAWAGTSATVDLTVAADTAGAAARLLRRATDQPTPRTVTLRPAHPAGPPDRARLMAMATLLDPLQPLTVRARGDTHHMLTTSVTHTITPHDWTTTLALTPERT